MAKKKLTDVLSDIGAGNFEFPENPGKIPEIGGDFSGNSGNGYKEEAETAVEDLRNKYSQKARAEFENKAQKLRQERDAALRENWILQQKAEAALPEQMAAAGINGGASESTLANLRAQYQGNRNDIRSGYMDNLGDLSVEQSAQQAEAERAYNEQWLDYLLSLSKMEEEYEQKKALAAYGE